MKTHQKCKQSSAQILLACALSHFMSVLVCAGNKGSRVSAIPKPRPAGDRAKKAEAAFAARRAAALAKGKK